MRYILEVCAGTDPPPEWKDADFDRVLPLHVALQSAVYYRGRLGEVERLAWAAAGRGPVTATLAEIYRIAAARLGVAPGNCVFVDDQRRNVDGAVAAGMVGVHHCDTDSTLAELEILLGLELRC